MQRAQLSVDELRERNLEAQRRYREKHSEQLMEKRMACGGVANFKRREERRTSLAKLVEAGVFVPMTAGRKRLYTAEESIEVAKRQRRVRPEPCWLRERLWSSRRIMTGPCFCEDHGKSYCQECGFAGEPWDDLPRIGRRTWERRPAECKHGLFP